MTKWRPSDCAWASIGVGVVAFDLLCEDGDTLSEAADRYMLHHRWLVRSVGVALVVHVCNMIPDRLDVVHWLFLGVRRLRRTAR